MTVYVAWVFSIVMLVGGFKDCRFLAMATLGTFNFCNSIPYFVSSFEL